ncbi:MAG: single-stranded DNA-binding protein [Bifidobacteriaceae bacterium]|nr:single-stranded DNA-binding protein [Bifidobacteriaceae bacterium]
MSQQATVTIEGIVGSDPKKTGHEGSIPFCTFRVGSNRGFWNRKTNQWQDSPTTWTTIKCYKNLALNVLSSVSKGDPVIISGNLVTDSWERDGVRRSQLSIEATAVGHNLTSGTSVYRRNIRENAYQKAKYDSQAYSSPQPGLQTAARQTAAQQTELNQTKFEQAESSLPQNGSNNAELSNNAESGEEFPGFEFESGAKNTTENKMQFNRLQSDETPSDETRPDEINKDSHIDKSTDKTTDKLPYKTNESGNQSKQKQKPAENKNGKQAKFGRKDMKTLA